VCVVVVNAVVVGVAIILKNIYMLIRIIRGYGGAGKYGNVGRIYRIYMAFIHRPYLRCTTSPCMHISHILYLGKITISM